MSAPSNDMLVELVVAVLGPVTDINTTLVSYAIRFRWGGRHWRVSNTFHVEEITTDGMLKSSLSARLMGMLLTQAWETRRPVCA